MDLMYVRSTTSTGSSVADWSQLVLVSGDAQLMPISLAVIDGNPAIAYSAYAEYDFNYIRSTTSNGANQSDWSQLVTIFNDMQGWILEASLVQINGAPAIAYYDDPDADLKYVRASTSTGTGASDWEGIETVDGPDEVGRYPSLAVVNGNPAISYQDHTNNSALKYAYYVP